MTWIECLIRRKINTGTTAGKQQLYLKHIHVQTKKTQPSFTKCANRTHVRRKKWLVSLVNSRSHEIMVTFHEQIKGFSWEHTKIPTSSRIGVKLIHLILAKRPAHPVFPEVKTTLGVYILISNKWLTLTFHPKNP